MLQCSNSVQKLTASIFTFWCVPTSPGQASLLSSPLSPASLRRKCKLCFGSMGGGVRGDAKTNSHLTSGPYHAMLHSKVTPSLPQPSKLQCYIVLGTWLHVHNTITCQTKLSKRRVRLSCATAVRKCRRVRANSNLTSGTRPNSFSNLALNLSSWCLLTTGNFSADRSHRREIPDTMGEFEEEEKKTEGQDD